MLPFGLLMKVVGSATFWSTYEGGRQCYLLVYLCRITYFFNIIPYQLCIKNFLVTKEFSQAFLRLILPFKM